MQSISFSNFATLLNNLKNTYHIFTPVKKGDQRFYKTYADFTDDIVIGEVRPVEPLKSFFSRAREIVARGFKPDIPHSQDKPFCIVGVKACDLKSFKVQDYVFKNHDYPDPFYIKTREDTLIISADCTLAIDTCFCLAAGIKPYPQEDFDINLSFLESGFTIECGSAKGQTIIKKYSSLFEEAQENKITNRNKQRNRVIKKVEENIKEHDTPYQDLFKNIIERNYESSIWDDQAKTCVECGACTAICPTCHCFLLYDQSNKKNMARLRAWDSCMIKDYARVAGGANPRPKLWMRLRNRFEKKFDFFPKVADVYACTGCGRCISTCPAKIDIRKVLKKLVENA
ncbi:MAG: 4Fe-4S dicluster domain-containing protein [Candidatus Omnitrophota bacterium]|nr:MAG: 4Fe-4S dicluster domain-containing protein [Candidatus Omnitrophota bacterium]